MEERECCVAREAEHEPEASFVRERMAHVCGGEQAEQRERKADEQAEHEVELRAGAVEACAWRPLLFLL